MSLLPPSRRAFAVGLGVAAVAQLALAGTSFWPALARAPQDWRWMTAPVPPEPPTEGMRAFRAMPEVLRGVPDDAPVLVVSGLAAVQFEYYVLPRPMRLLQALPQAWIDLARQHVPELVDEIVRRRERLDERGLLLTRARLRDAVGLVRFVVVAGPEPVELAAVRARLEPVRSLLGFALYAVGP
ncbi:MAG: hypothetical protein R3F56_14170 [Planctomycetota bacterium]